MTEESKLDPIMKMPVNNETADDFVTEPEELPKKNSENVEKTTLEPLKKQNVTQTVEVSETITEIDDSDYITALPSDFSDRIIKQIDSSPNVKLSDSKQGREWATTISEGIQKSSFDGVYRDTLEDPEAFFEQSVQSEAGALAASASKFKRVENETLKGERAVMRLMTHLGLGAVFRVPLWNSGFWITLKAPSEADLLELQREIISDKILLGRSSYGLAHSNTTSYMVDRVLDFALKHMYQSTLKTTEDIRSMISCHDIPTVIWGLACTIWPHGFQYQRSCTVDIEKCQHVVKERLNLGKILWTNTKNLSQWQIAHMTSLASNSMEVDQVKRYCKESLFSQNRQVIIFKGTDREIKFILKVPSATQYIESGYKWIGEITDVVNQAITSDKSINEKNAYIASNGKATALRQYTHWVHSIEFNTNLIEDTETIETTLNALSSDDSIREELMKHIAEYINHTTATVIGIPVFDCPVCGEEQKSNVPLPRHTNIIPIDVYTTFFTLLVQKIQKIETRLDGKN